MKIRSTLESLALAPGIRQLRKAAFQRRYLANRYENLFSGVYASFEEAVRACPEDRPKGYDNEESASLYSTAVQEYDYPSLFWLQHSVDAGLHSVFDLGGHTGIKYYAFRPLLRVPPAFRWQVGDVPAVVARGRAIAAERGEQSLSFADDATRFEGADILFASGSLQYLPQTLPELLAQNSERPRRIIANITPLHESRAFFTVNSIGTAYCAYRVQCFAELVSGLEALGYRQLAVWKHSNKHLELPFHPGFSVHGYHGLCLERS